MKPAPSLHHRTHRPRAARVGAWVVVAAALAAVFAAYLQPQMVFDLATRVWSCF